MSIDRSRAIFRCRRETHEFTRPAFEIDFHDFDGYYLFALFGVAYIRRDISCTRFRHLSTVTISATHCTGHFSTLYSISHAGAMSLYAFIFIILTTLSSKNAFVF